MSLCNFWLSVFNSWFSFSIFADDSVWVSLLLLFLSAVTLLLIISFWLIISWRIFLFPLCFSSCTVLFSFCLLLLAFHSQADSGEEITDNFLHPRFKLGAQSGLDGSNRIAGLPKIKWLPQTCSVKFFSASWDGVKSLRLILYNHISRLCPDNFCEVSSVFTMLGRRKNPSFGTLLQFFAQPTTLQDVTMTFNLKKINSIGTWNKFSEFCFFQICWSVCLTGYCCLG